MGSTSLRVRVCPLSASRVALSSPCLPYPPPPDELSCPRSCQGTAPDTVSVPGTGQTVTMGGCQGPWCCRPVSDIFPGGESLLPQCRAAAPAMLQLVQDTQKAYGGRAFVLGLGSFRHPGAFMGSPVPGPSPSQPVANPISPAFVPDMPIDIAGCPLAIICPG